MKRARLSEQIVNEIQRMIRDEGFSDGDRFYSENVLTKKLDVSRASVREAIRILEISGKVTVRQGKGIFVSDPISKGVNTFAAWLQSNEADLRDHFEMRRILEPKAASLAAEKADEKDLEAMEGTLDAFSRQVASETREGIIEEDRIFHLALAKSTRNRPLYILMKTMAESLSEGWISSLNIPGRAERTVAEHKAIFDAIKARDPKRAEKVMMAHLENAEKEILDYMQRQG
ncbi:FadR/GntR family transcriptional regulator [Desulfoluna spongiiphila]|uniref:Transcriptional regulator, GntR family n=1 Tax=Desulfoluna spongiiphila TaxID=419481 RepID=A0A1G5HEA1_9BACT|nr:FadR/GntR family transcriptional regulator [Desulfoluna spongiiphila]SCY62067.1 transcriptional regulator, GntR family [Desulfoluna spongiiphila]